MNKKCPKCGNDNKTSSSYCPKCHNDYQKKYYKKNPDSINKSNTRRKKKIRNIILKEKDKLCADCGEKYPYYIMDFDHVRGKKLFNLSVAARKIVSIKVLEKEIAKCEVVCANCHRERTFKIVGSIPTSKTKSC